MPFLLGVVGLSLPFWIGGAVTDLEMLPGLPIGALMIFAPVGSAVLLTYRRTGTDGVAALLGRALDFRRIRSPHWLVPILLLYPGAMVAAYVVLRILGSPLPDAALRMATVPVLLGVFLVAGLAEELGWSGYAIDRLQARRGPLAASLLLGAFWAAWHVIPLIQVGRAAGWILWWCVYTVSSRVIYTWIYNGAGRSVFAVALLHAVANLSWQMFPNNGSHFDPRVGGLLLAGIAAVVVAARWPGTRDAGAASDIQGRSPVE